MTDLPDSLFEIIKSYKFQLKRAHDTEPFSTI